MNKKKFQETLQVLINVPAMVEAIIGKKAIRKGEMAMTVFQSAYGQANASIIAAINMLENVNVAEGTECDISSESKYVLYYPYVPVTIDNVNSIE